MRPKKRPGQALVEFAIVWPVLIALLIGIIDVGWLYNHQLILTNASREGARLGALGQSSSNVLDGVKTYLQNSGYSPMPPDGNIAITLSSTESKVAISSSVPFLFAISGPALTLQATTRMRHE